MFCLGMYNKLVRHDHQNSHSVEIVRLLRWQSPSSGVLCVVFSSSSYCEAARRGKREDDMQRGYT